VPPREASVANLLAQKVTSNVEKHISTAGSHRRHSRKTSAFGHEPNMTFTLKMANATLAEKFEGFQHTTRLTPTAEVVP
jgi:hypothetical protein